VRKLAKHRPSRLVISGDAHFFSFGADLYEIAALTDWKHSSSPKWPRS